EGRVGRGADELLLAHSAPGRDVTGGRRVVGQHAQDTTDPELGQPPGQRDDRERAALTAAVEQFHAHSPLTPASSRRPAPMPGSSARKRCTCAAVVSRCSDTRTLPCESTPIASSTWLGRSVDEVHDEPDETAKPRRSSACSKASPSTYRQENVTRCGRRSTG